MEDIIHRNLLVFKTYRAPATQLLFLPLNIQMSQTHLQMQKCGQFSEHTVKGFLGTLFQLFYSSFPFLPLSLGTFHISMEKHPHSDVEGPVSVLKASCPRRPSVLKRVLNQPEQSVTQVAPQRVSYSPPFLRFSHMTTKRAWCLHSQPAVNVCPIPGDFTAGFLSFYPVKESQQGYLINLEGRRSSSCTLSLSNGKGSDHRGLANREGGLCSAFLRFSMVTSF